MNPAHLDLVFVVLKRLHDHEHRLQLPVHATVVTIEAVHTAADVTEQADQLGLLLRGAHR